jgi:hypothetical protein
MKQRLGLVVVAVVAAAVGYHLAPIDREPQELRLAQEVQPGATRHLALNTAATDYAALVELGYDVFDVGPSPEAIAAIPEGGQALVWVGQFTCEGGFALPDADFQAAVDALADDPKVYGWYLADEPDVAGCPAALEAIRARADYVEANAPDQVTFVAASTARDLAPLAPESSHVDLIGLDPFPCAGAAATCDMATITGVAEAATTAGIPIEAIVPIFQTFGSECATNQGWQLPSEEELGQILSTWGTAVPNPQLEISYAWGNLPGWTCPTLADADGSDDVPDLQSAMREHNTGAAAPPADEETTTTAASSSSSSTATTEPGADDGDAAAAPAAPTTGPTAAEALGYTTPAWSEDFDTYSEDRWMTYGGPSEHTPGEFTPTGGGERKREQITTADGVMTITGLPNGDTAGMSTEADGGHAQQYGLWEARVKLPAGATDYHSVMILMVGAAEIDFMEDMDPAGRSVDGFLHTPGGEGHGNVTMEDNDWHNWAIEWTPEYMRLYLDGEMWHESRMGEEIDVPAEPGIMTIQLDWFPSDDGETATAEFQVDWVRIYEQQGGGADTGEDAGAEA